jgi:hypothetical protein
MELFYCTTLTTTLTTSYYTDLKVAIETVIGEYSNSRHQIKDTSQEVCHLVYQIVASQSITKRPYR